MPDPTSLCLRTADRTAPPVGVVPLPVTLVLARLRSAFNVGNIFRLAEATGAERIMACGYTPAPPHPKLEKTARGTDRRVCCEQRPDLTTALTELRQRGYTIYAVETVDGAKAVWDVALRFPAALVLGNEALGIDADELAACDEVLCLPCRGLKNSVNVANCAAVVLYEALRQWLRRSPAAAAVPPRPPEDGSGA